MSELLERQAHEKVEDLKHIFIGPTWRKDDTGQWVLPERTIGWQIVQWCTEYLLAEDGGPWIFTLEQLRFVLWWYAVDEGGRFIYRKGVLQRMKGWGKDPLLAVLCLVELCGPSRVEYRSGRPVYGDDGQPVGVPHPAAWVQVTAVNQAQTTNTMSLLPSLISDKLRQTYDIKDGAEIVRANGGKCRLVAVTSSYRALEGGRTTFTLLNETHHWIVGNGGIKMYETIDGNATKKDSRYLAITNAYLPSENSVAQKMRESWQAIQDGRTADIGFLYDSLEAHPETPLTPEALAVVLPIIRGDAVWLNPKTIIQSVLDTTMPTSRSRRMWLNQIVAEEDALYTPSDLEPLLDYDLELQAGDEVVLGFDGGKTHDSTALVAIRVKDQAAFLLALEEKPDGPAGEGWEVNRTRIENAVHAAFRTYKVKGFYADVSQWESYIADWTELYREELLVKASETKAIAWDMRQGVQKITRAHERVAQAIYDAKIRLDGNALDLRRHILNAYRVENNYGVYFGKESHESPKKVDAYAALMLAYEALHDLRTRVKPQKERTGRVYFF